MQEVATKLSKAVKSILEHANQAKVLSADLESNSVTVRIAEGVTATLDVSEAVSKLNLESDTEVTSLESFVGQYAQIGESGVIMGFSPELVKAPVKAASSGRTPSKTIPDGLRY